MNNIRHSLAHILAHAVLETFPGTKLGIGPTIEHGFYYDFLFPKNVKANEEYFEELETRMKKIIKEDWIFSGKKVTPAEARKIFKDEPFKLELIKEFIKEKKQLSVYYTCPPSVKGQKSKVNCFVDLCQGGHVKRTTEINPDAFTLISVAGAYWRGNERNQMLTRIYGTAFKTKRELDAHLTTVEEMKKRDHRKLGKQLGIYIINDLVGKGLPLWLPNGTIVKDEIEKLAIEMEKKYGYLRVSTPHLAKKEIYVMSGHLPYYEDSMYPGMEMDDGTYYIRAMNCPHHHIIYKSKPRSYRELPLRLAEYGTVYRNELSGTLAGLLRVRMLSMNDAHIYCTKEQIGDEFKNVLSLTLEYFKIFGFKDYWFQLSRWNPKNTKKYINEPANWKYAEKILSQTLKKLGVKFIDAPDEAAFYGPKVDAQFKSVIGREETMSTIQLDFTAKKRFSLTYIDRDGKENNEVFVIHRAPLSTHERLIAFLLEHYAGAFPLWLAPIQVEVLPVGKKFLPYAKRVTTTLQKHNIRAELDDADETLSKRIRTAELQKIPYIAVVGNKEKQDKTINVRTRHVKKTETLTVNAFTKKLLNEITRRK